MFVLSISSAASIAIMVSLLVLCIVLTIQNNQLVLKSMDQSTLMLTSNSTNSGCYESILTGGQPLSISQTLATSKRSLTKRKKKQQEQEKLVAAQPKSKPTSKEAAESETVVATKNKATSSKTTTTSKAAAATVVQKPKVELKNIPNHCECVYCADDYNCGGLWKGTRYTKPTNETDSTALELLQIADMTTTTTTNDLKAAGVRAAQQQKQQIHVVISHCMMDTMDWITDYVAGYELTSVHIVSTCNKTISVLPTNPAITTVEAYTSTHDSSSFVVEKHRRGHHHHTYAQYISSVLPQKIKAATKRQGDVPIVVVFLKDTRDAEHTLAGQTWLDFHSLLTVASSPNAFSCGIIPPDVRKRRHGKPPLLTSFSMYHDTQTAFNYTAASAAATMFQNSQDEEKVTNNVGDFYNSIQNTNAHVPAELVPVCYGGFFAASYHSIMKHYTNTNRKKKQQKPNTVWKNIEAALSSSSSGSTATTLLQAEEYMERLWGVLLSKPLPTYQIAALKSFAHTQNGPKEYAAGMLVYKPGQRTEATTA